MLSKLTIAWNFLLVSRGCSGVAVVVVVGVLAVGGDVVVVVGAGVGAAVFRGGVGGGVGAADVVVFGGGVVGAGVLEGGVVVLGGGVAVLGGGVAGVALGVVSDWISQASPVFSKQVHSFGPVHCPLPLHVLPLGPLGHS